MLNYDKLELIIGNSNKRFSGVTSTMLQVLPYQQKIMELAVMGDHHLPENFPSVSFFETLKLCRKPLNNGKLRIFHARRNDEMIQALILKYLFGAKIIPIFTSTAQRHHSYFTRWLMAQMSGIISTCSAANGYLKKPADIIIPHGVDLKNYFPAKDKARAWEDLNLPGKYGIGIFGRIRHQKGLDLLIDAVLPLLKNNPDPTVVIVGETTAGNNAYLEHQMNKVKAAGLSERFAVLGKRDFHEIPSLFRAMTLVTALSRNEGFGLTIPEAMASGTAVLASEAGAWKDIVRDGIDGHLVPCDSSELTKEALEKMISNPEMLIEMGKSGRERIESCYTIEQEAQSLCNYFAELQNKYC